MVDAVQDLQLSVVTQQRRHGLHDDDGHRRNAAREQHERLGLHERDISYVNATTGQFAAQRIDPTGFAGVPATATSWNLTRVEFQGRRSGTATENLHVQVRSSGDPSYRPTSEVLGEVMIPEGNLTSSTNWNTVTFASPLRGLALHRAYDLVWTGQLNEAGNAAKLVYHDVADSNVRQVNESIDGGNSWQISPDRQNLLSRVRHLQLARRDVHRDSQLCDARDRSSCKAATPPILASTPACPC